MNRRHRWYVRAAGIAACAAVLIAGSAGIAAGPRDDIRTRIERVENGLRSSVPIKGEPGMNILERLKFYNVPGVSVAVISDDKIDWAKGYGVMDVETKTPVTEKTLFVAGSVSKPVAAMGALRLVQEGKIHLDVDINDALTSWKLPDNEFTKEKKATIRLILSHNAGITVHGFRGYAAGETLPTLRQILDGESPANSAPIRVDTEPGKIWRYSGGGVTVMQQALIDIEKKPFPEILREKVLAPIGMTSSSYEQTFSSERLPFAASGHDAKGQVIQGKRFIYPEMAAAGLWTTPTDLAKFAIEVQLSIQGQSNKVLARDIARLMVTPRVKIIKGQNMALGFFLEKGDAYFGHGGQDTGFICALTAAVEGGYGAVVMTNSEGRSSPLIMEIFRSIAVEYGWKNYVPAPIEVVAVPPDKLKDYEGRFLINSDSVLTIKLEGSKLMGREIGEVPFELLAAAPGDFVRLDRETRYVYDKVGDLTLRNQAGETRAARMKAGVKVPLEDLLESRYDEAAGLYRKIFKANPKDPNIDEQRLNSAGYQLIQAKKLDAALTLFKLNVEFYPASWNAYDSLGEAYMTKGDTQAAIANYEKSLQLNPKNVNGAKTLEKLKKK